MLKELEYIYAVYQEKSFSRAAQRLFITQPALSNKVKKVEEQLRMPLFDRSTNPIQLTAAGQAYIQAVEKIMAVEKELDEQLQALATKRSGSITVGSAAFFCAHVLPELTMLFQEQHPGYTVNLLEGNTDDLIQCLQSDVVTFTLNVDPMDSTAYVGQPWGSELILLAVPAHLDINQALAAQRLTFDEVRYGRAYQENCPRTNLSHFQEQEFLLLKKGNDLHRRALKMCRRAGFQPNVKLYLDQMLTSFYVARDGYGVTFVRSAITQYVEETDRLFFYRLDDPDVVRIITLYYKKDAEQSPITRDFIQFMKNVQPSSPLDFVPEP